MERIQTDPFPGDPDANAAVIEVRNRVRAYADLSRKLAHGGYSNDVARGNAISAARSLIGDIRARSVSGGVAPHEWEKFLEAARRAAEARYGCKLTIFPLPNTRLAPHDPAAARLRDDAAALETRIAELGKRRDRASRQAIRLEAEIVAAGRELGDVNAALARRQTEAGL